MAQKTRGGHAPRKYRGNKAIKVAFLAFCTRTFPGCPEIFLQSILATIKLIGGIGKGRRQMLRVLGVALSVLALDAVTKRLALRLLAGGQSIALVPGVLYFSYVRNPGGAYGILAGNRWILVGISLAVIAAALFYARRLRRPLHQSVMGVLIGGAAGNLVDRLLWGKVVDFIEIKPLPVFRVFNVADVAITFSAAAIMLYLLSPPRTASGQHD